MEELPNILEMDDEQIRQMYSDLTYHAIDQIAESLNEMGFPANRKIPYTGTTASNTPNPAFWRREDNVRASNLCNEFWKLPKEDATNYRFLVSLKNDINNATKSYQQRAEAKMWVENGGKCVYRYGWGWKGAGTRTLSQEDALAKFPSYGFGMGFYTLSWIEIDGEKVLEFNELSENDML